MATCGASQITAGTQLLLWSDSLKILLKAKSALQTPRLLSELSLRISQNCDRDELRPLSVLSQIIQFGLYETQSPQSLKLPVSSKTRRAVVMRPRRQKTDINHRFGHTNKTRTQQHGGSLCASAVPRNVARLMTRGEWHHRFESWHSGTLCCQLPPLASWTEPLPQRIPSFLFLLLSSCLRIKWGKWHSISWWMVLDPWVPFLWKGRLLFPHLHKPEDLTPLVYIRGNSQRTLGSPNED